MKKLLVITTPDFFNEEAGILTKLFDEGLETLHIRKPQADKDSLEKLITGIPQKYHSDIVLHDCFQLATMYNLKGIHLNRRNKKIPKGFTGGISRSCHSIEEIKDITAYNHVFLSPVFPSISKAGYDTCLSSKALQEAAGAGFINNKIIALGGISPVTIPLLKEIPFGGVAVLGSVWGETMGAICPSEVIKRFVRLQNSLNIITE